MLPQAFASFHQYTTNACSGCAYKIPFGSRETEGRGHVGSCSELRHTLTTHTKHMQLHRSALVCDYSCRAPLSLLASVVPSTSHTERFSFLGLVEVVGESHAN